ncbi:MAG: hypothetical protein H6636_05980 [Anaerolineales bacterium]|nr:hypothetical protein [Anaerolineales bacterium]
MRTKYLLFACFLSFFMLAVFLAGNAKFARAAERPFTVTWYVNGDSGDDNNDCLTPVTACETVGGTVNKASSGDTLEIAAGTYVEHLDINLDLSFHGAGMDATFLDGGQTGRTFIAASSHITLTNLTVQNGLMTGSGTINAGGGILNYGGLMLDQVRVRGNSSEEGGGGIFTSGPITLQNSEIVSNTTDGGGGGIYLWFNGTVNAMNTLFGWNDAAIGGGVYNTGQFTAADSTFRNNHAGISGGGVDNTGNGVTTLAGVAIFQNQSDGIGGGVLVELGTMYLTNVTISGNSGSDYAGAAVVNPIAQMTVLNTTIADNLVPNTSIKYGGIGSLGGAVTFKNTIVANNAGRQCLANGTWTSEGYNLSSDTYCAFTQPGDTQNTDPMLAPFADYSGPTFTYALLPGSPAIDTGTNTGCPTTDQRGVTRPFDGDNDGTATCDKGAFEAQNQLAIADTTLLEGDTGTITAVFTVTLTPTSTQSVTVNYATVDETATAGSDYQATNGTLTFDPGESTQVINVLVNGDTDDEPNETFFVYLSNANADILDGVGTGTIVDNDGLPSLTINDMAVNEGNIGSTNALFTVTLSPADAQTVTVDFATANGTASAGSDYTAINGTLTFAPGVVTQTISVPILGDIVDEGISEVFSVLLTNASNATLVDDTAQTTILDDDIATLSLSYTPPIVEGNAGSQMMTFTVTLSLPTSFPVTVDYYTQSGVGGTFATPGVDYEETSGTLTFAAGQTTQTFTVTVYSDLEEESDENFSVRLINADPVSIYASAATGLIEDDDGNPQIYLPLIVR